MEEYQYYLIGFTLFLLFILGLIWMQVLGYKEDRRIFGQDHKMNHRVRVDYVGGSGPVIVRCLDCKKSHSYR